MNDNKKSYHLPSARSPRACSYCGKVFATLYALGGHMTAHRVEMEQTRREHVASMVARSTAGTAAGGAVRYGSNVSGLRTVDFLGLGPSMGKDGDVQDGDCSAKLNVWSVGDDNEKGKGLDLDLSLKL